jgi:hypothetical protein
MNLIRVTNLKQTLLTDGNFHQLLNINGIKDVRHREMHIALPLVPESRYFKA